MNSYDEFKNYITSHFEPFKSIAVNEIINYYGEEYRDQIISRINNTSFVFYVNPNIKLKSKEDNISLKKYYKSIRNEIMNNNKSKEIFNSTGIVFPIAKHLMNDNDTCFTYSYNKYKRQVDKLIMISLFCNNDEGIIHEMIHASVFTPLLLAGGDCSSSLNCKNGINVLNHKGEDLLEECITQIDASRIAKRLKSKGVSFLNGYYPYKEFRCIYNLFIPFMYSFYDEFKSEITEARLSLNLNKLMHIVGKENYLEYINLFEEFYKDYYDCDKSFYKYFLDKNVEKMKGSKCQILKKN